MTDTARFRVRMPAHVILMLGASTAGYAVVLAGVAALQSQAEAAISSARLPGLVALDSGADANDLLSARLDVARDEYADVAAAYETVSRRLDDMHAGLVQLTTIVGKIEGASRALPATVQLPAVRASVPVTRMPVTDATTRASGG